MKIGELRTLLESITPQNNKIKKIDTGVINMQTATPLISVGDNDLETAMTQRPKKAVDYLMSKSPIGMKLPSDKELESIGYPRQCMDMNGNSHYDNGLSVYTHAFLDDGDAYYKAVYKTDRFEQIMYYDKDGNLLKGDFKIKDKTQNFTEATYTIWKNEKGGYSYIG